EQMPVRATDIEPRAVVIHRVQHELARRAEVRRVAAVTRLRAWALGREIRGRDHGRDLAIPRRLVDAYARELVFEPFEQRRCSVLGVCDRLHASAIAGAVAVAATTAAAQGRTMSSSAP